MGKVQFSDVVPPERRSIRDIPIPSSGKRKQPVIIKPETLPVKKMNYTATDSVSNSVSEKISDLKDLKESKAYEYYYPKDKQKSAFEGGNVGRPNNKKKFIFGSLILLTVAGFLFVMMTVFASATVLISPKNQPVDVSMDISGTVEAKDDSVRYEIIKLSRSQTEAVVATGEESVKVEARGKIVVYNNFSSEPQRLIVRTRFETPEGLVYRIPESIVVPGKTVAGPGSIEVEVVADEPGEKYNIKKTDFTVPGFKSDTDRYKGFYGRSVTDITGGFVGKMKTVSVEDKKTALDKIESEAQSILEKELQSKVPEGLALLPKSVIYESRELPQTEESSSVLIGKEVTAYAIMLNSKDLSNKVIGEYISNYPDWEKIKASIQDFSLLEVTSKPNKIVVGDKIDLKLNGKVKLVAEIDTDLIGQRLVGMQRKEITKLMDEFVGISSITVTIRPIWKQSFPENPLKIKVKVGSIE